MNLVSRAKQLKTDIPAIFIAFKKRQTPIAAKILAAIAIGYVLSPLDLIPDFIPIIGLLDDIILIPVLIAIIIKLIPSNLFAQCRLEAENLWKDGIKTKWYYAIPIILLWLFIVFFIIKAIWL